MGYKSRGNFRIGWGESKVKVMSNKERRELGIDQDPNLPDYKPEQSEVGNESVSSTDR